MKPSHILSWIIQLGIAAVLAMAGLMKLTGHPEAVLVFRELDFNPGGRLVIGVLEILTALLLIIPQSAIWAAVLAWGIMTGALIAHVTHLGFGQHGFFAIAIWVGGILIIGLRRHQSQALRHMFEREEPPEEVAKQEYEPPP